MSAGEPTRESGGGAGDPDDIDDSPRNEVSGPSASGILSALLSNPRRFVVGALAASVIEWTVGIVSIVLEVLTLIVAGSQPETFAAEGETLGIADVPVFVAGQLTGVGGTVGGSILDAIRALNEPLFNAAAFAGPVTPIIVGAIVVVEVIAVIWVLQRAVYVAADLLQLGGLTE